MNLTINLTGASLDELTTIFYRLGEPGISEVWEAEKINSLQQYINSGSSLAEALDKFEAQVQQKVNEIEQPQAANIQPEQIPFIPIMQDTPPEVLTPPTIDPAYVDMPRIQPGQPNNELHLDGAPAPVIPNPQPQAKDITEMLRQTATKVVEKYGSKHLTDMLKPYEANSIMDLNEFHKAEFLKKLQSELAA